MNVHLGFEVGSGAPVEIPLAHTFVCGQTQLSGKTTTLQAIVTRSGQRALAFVTKRGEAFDGRRIRPYIPRRSDQPIHWRVVETMLASAVDAKNLKYERLWVINAAKGAFSLDDVQANVHRLLAKTKNDKVRDIYTLLDEYLELVLPQMRALDASDVLDLQPGLNVMDLAGLSTQTQAMVIRAALERINHHETEVLTVLPEAWEFAPRGRSAPAKDEAIAMARKGAAPKVRNFLLVDSQDIAGVEPVIRQACSVWLIGVQRELNELKRGVQMIPAGIKRPSAADVATLELGQFFACWGRHALKVYVQPSFMEDGLLAQMVARGTMTAQTAAAMATAGNVSRAASKVFGDLIPRPRPQVKEDEVNAAEANTLRDNNARLTRENADLRRRLDALEGDTSRHAARRAGAAAPARESVSSDARPPDLAPPSRASAGHAPALDGSDAAYSAMLSRLIQDAAKDPTLLRIIATRPELEVRVQRRIITAEGTSTKGRVALLLANGLLDEPKRFREILNELERRGTRLNNKTLSITLTELVVDGFLTKEGVQRYVAVPGMKVNIVEAA